jgi:hypothetical protein
MLVSIDLDESTEDQLVAVYEVAGTLIRIKSRPAVARGKGEEDEEEAAAAAAGDGGGGSAGDGGAPTPGPTQAKYAQVGLVLWQAGLVAADWIIRHRQPQAPQAPAKPKPNPPASKSARLAGLSVVELGCGVGQCAIALAAAGAGPVVMTDLPHVVPLAAENARLNASAMAAAATGGCVVAVPHVWGDDAAPVLEALRSADGGAGGGPPDLIVAADCLYEPSVYPLLLRAIDALSGPHTRTVLCHRLRVYGERGFESSAEAAGFDVLIAPREELHADYACGGWRLVELSRRRPRDEAVVLQQQQAGD